MYDNQEIWARSCGQPNLPMPISSRCVPVDTSTVKGMTCWCKTNLCNTDLIPSEVIEPSQSTLPAVKRAHLRIEDPEL